MSLSRCGDNDVGKTRRVTMAARQIGQSAGNFGGRGVERQNAFAIKVQQGLQPG